MIPNNHDGEDLPTREEYRREFLAPYEDTDSMSVESPVLEGGDRPAVSRRLRTAAYWATVGTAALALGAKGLTTIWAPDLAAPVSESIDVLSNMVALVGGAFGVIYRPTR